TSRSRPVGTVVEPGEFGMLCRITDGDTGGEPVPLCFGKRVRAVQFDRVLGGDDHERGGEWIGRRVNGDLLFRHAFQQCRLGFRGSSVDLVPDDYIGEHRTGTELETVGLSVEDRYARDVARQQVGSELDSTHPTVDGSR